MAGSINKVILVGNLGRDPEVRTFQNGDKVVNINLATSETWKDRNTGEKRERTEWHRVAIFGGVAGVAEKYTRKGSKVYIEGKLETRKWQDQSGQDRYSTEVVIRPYGGNLVLLGDSGGRSGDGGYSGYSGDPGPGASGGASGGGTAPADLDDEIPF